MSEQVVILLHSKYSEACKSLFEIMESSTVNFEFIKLLCIDNQELREKIQTSELQITSIPCILILHRDGKMEKYEGKEAYVYIDTFVAPIREKQFQQEQLRAQQEQLRQQQEQLRAQQEQQRLEIERIQKAKETEIEMNRNARLESDRHRIVQQPPQVRDGAMGYDRSNEYFDNERPASSQIPPSAIRDSTAQAQADPHGTASKLKEFARERELAEQEIQKQRGGVIPIRE
jgi:hypothetical protein